VVEVVHGVVVCSTGVVEVVHGVVLLLCTGVVVVWWCTGSVVEVVHDSVDLLQES
jgi:hypothetical protein